MNHILPQNIFLLGTDNTAESIDLARYALVLARLGVNIIAEAPTALLELLNESMPVTWVPINQDLSENLIPAAKTSTRLKLSEIPARIGTNSHTPPFPSGYLQSNQEIKEYWRQRLETIPNPIIGLTWRPLALSSVLELIPTDINLVILEDSLTDVEIALLNKSHKLIDLSGIHPNIHTDYHQLAGLIAWLDGIVSTNPIIYQLAKAVGRPVWESTPDLSSTLELVIKKQNDLAELDQEELLFKTTKHRSHFNFINYCIVNLMNSGKYYRTLKIINTYLNPLRHHNQKYNYCLAHSTLSRLYQRYDYLEKAIEFGNQAIHYLPNDKKMILNLGKSYSDLNETEKAQALNKKAISLDPSYALGKVNYAIQLLLQGDYKKGFQYYQERWNMEDFKNREGLKNYKNYKFLSNLDISGKTLLIIDEQGLGDTIMLIRLFKQLKEWGAKIYFATKPTLFKLFEKLDTIDHLYEKNKDFPETDYACFLWDLPYLLKLDTQSIPNNTPYLFTEHKKIKLNKIGLCWRGNQKHTNDFLRSIPLEKLITGLSKNKNYISLQLAMHPLEYELLKKANIEKISDNISDFYDTACLINSLDLIITIDSSIAHVAGALNIPTIVLLPYSADWRWGLNRSDSPWYPSVTLIRQPAYGDWDSVMQELKARIS